MTFEMEQAKHKLQDVFGYSQFREPQGEVISQLFNGGHAFVLMPTGGGKSLCYQIPALVMPGLTVVVSPLIALMQDQILALRANGVSAAGIHSALNQSERRQVFRALHERRLDLLYVSPERLALQSMRDFLADLPIALLAFDEAHCVSQWGHDFRPDYQALADFVDQFSSVPRIALTATANEVTRQDIIRALRLEQAKCFVGDFDRPNIHYAVEEAQEDQRLRLLHFIRQAIGEGSGIVYCTTKKKVEEVCQWLCDRDIKAIAYHAGMSQADREVNLNRFLQEDGMVAVATVAFGMGIDKADVRFVAHLNLPKSLEAYYQETGRAGRDGLPSHAWMSYSLADLIQLRRWVKESTAGPRIQQIESQKLNAMAAYAETSQCRRQVLLGYFGQQRAQPCGNCDNCHEPPAIDDVTVHCQKALSTVHRTAQRFGIGHNIAVLRGANTDRIRKFGHQRLSTYGIGKDLSEIEWKRIFQQLILIGALDVDVNQYSSLKLKEPCRDILKGTMPVHLRVLSAGKIKSQQQMVGQLNRRQSSLLKLIKNLRRALSKVDNIPASSLFSDATLIDLVKLCPKDMSKLMQVQGFGQEKCQKFGAVILGFLSHVESMDDLTLEEGFSLSMWYSLFEFQHHYDLDVLIKRRGLTRSTLESHLIQGAEKAWIAYEDLPFLLSDQQSDEIKKVLQADESASLSSIAAQLDQRYSYGEIRFVQSLMLRQSRTSQVEVSHEEIE